MIMLEWTNGHLPVVELLVSKGADIHVDDEYLRYASNNGYLPCSNI